MIHDIYGHKKQIAFLNKSIQMGKLSHAFVFSGPAFVGKKFVAQQFARTLLALEQTPPSPVQLSDEHQRVAGYPLPQAGEGKKSWDFHPDYLEIPGEQGIKIEQVRELIYKLSLKPYQAKYKVAVIDNSENMTTEAQNALLKVLEEPKSYTIIILITTNPGKLLRTITSRALKINFGPVETKDYEHAVSGTLDAETKDLILTLASGRPGLAMSISSEEDLVGRIKKLSRDFDTVINNDMAEKLRLAYDMADLETADLKQSLDFWLIKFGHQLRSTPDIKSARNLSEINQARKYLDQNVNSKLILTNLMLNLT